MDIIITEIKDIKEDKKQKFDENIKKVLNFMRKRYSTLSKVKEKKKNINQK